MDVTANFLNINYEAIHTRPQPVPNTDLVINPGTVVHGQHNGVGDVHVHVHQKPLQLVVTHGSKLHCTNRKKDMHIKELVLG